MAGKREKLPDLVLNHKHAEDRRVAETPEQAENFRTPAELETLAQLHIHESRKGIEQPLLLGQRFSKHIGGYDTREKRYKKLEKDIWLARELYIQLCKLFIARHDAEGSMPEKEIAKYNRMRLTRYGHPGIPTGETGAKEPDPMIFNEAKDALQAWLYTFKTDEYNRMVDELYAEALARWGAEGTGVAEEMRFNRPANENEPKN